MDVGAYCKRCETNWSKLESQNNGEEIVEYCPQCKSALDLEEKHEGEGFWMGLRGVVYSALTGEPKPIEIKELPKVPIYKRKRLFN